MTARPTTTDIIGQLEIVLALELLEYHDRNYLSNDMCSSPKCSREKQRLLKSAIAMLGLDLNG